MNDGDIDYSRYTVAELREALAGIRRDVYPRNYANILAALSALEAAAAAAIPTVPELALDSGESEGLASRGSRLGAILIDAVIGSILVLPIMYFLGFWQLIREASEGQHSISFGTVLQLQAVGVVLFVLLQGYPLVRDGQTWGKKAVGIKIVDLLDRKPSLARLALRYGFTRIVGGIPILGGWVLIIDDCTIFRSDRRCLHDLIAGTRVVRAGPDHSEAR